MKKTLALTIIFLTLSATPAAADSISDLVAHQNLDMQRQSAQWQQDYATEQAAMQQHQMEERLQEQAEQQRQMQDQMQQQADEMARLQADQNNRRPWQ